MGYVFIITAVFAGLVKGFCAKKISGYSKKISQLSVLTCTRMFFCIVIGFFVVCITTGSFSSFTIDQKTLLVAFLCGLSMSIFLVSWLLAAQVGAYMLLEVFLTLGVIVPLVFSSFFFNERIVWLKWIGVALLAVASYIMSAYSNKIRGAKTSKLGFVFLCICCFTNGFTQFTQKWFTVIASERQLANLFVCDASTFNFYTYLFAFAILVCFVLLLRLAHGRKTLQTNENARLETVENTKDLQSETEDQKDGTYALIKRAWIFIFVMSACLFLHSYFTTRAADYLSSSELYPLLQGLSLVLSVVMSAIFFKERITKTCILGIFIAFIALLTINVFPAFL